MGNAPSRSSNSTSTLELTSTSESTSILESTSTLELTSILESTFTLKQGLEILPEDILKLIALNLNVSEIVQLSRVSRLLWELCSFFSHTVISTVPITTMRSNLSGLYDACRGFMPHWPLPRTIDFRNLHQSNFDRYKAPTYGLVVDNFHEKELPSWVNLSSLLYLIMYIPTSNMCSDTEYHFQLLEFLEIHKLSSLKAVVLDGIGLWNPTPLIDSFYKNQNLKYLRLINLEVNWSLDLRDFTSISILDITLTSVKSKFVALSLPHNLEKFKMHIKHMEPNSDETFQVEVKAFRCESLRYFEMIIDSDFIMGEFFVWEVPKVARLTTLISNKMKYTAMFRDSDYDWYTNLEVIHIPLDLKYPFLKMVEGEYQVDKKLCPKCTKFGLFDDLNNLRILDITQKFMTDCN